MASRMTIRSSPVKKNAASTKVLDWCFLVFFFLISWFFYTYSWTLWCALSVNDRMTTKNWNFGAGFHRSNNIFRKKNGNEITLTRIQKHVVVSLASNRIMLRLFMWPIFPNGTIPTQSTSRVLCFKFFVAYWILSNARSTNRDWADLDVNPVGHVVNTWIHRWWNQYLERIVRRGGGKIRGLRSNLSPLPPSYTFLRTK